MTENARVRILAPPFMSSATASSPRLSRFFARRRVWALALTALSSLPGATFAHESDQRGAIHALDTMAPAGRWAARLEVRANGYDTWFDNRGRERPLGYEFDGLTLDNSVFTALPGGVSLGTTEFSSRVDIAFAALTMGYGVNEDVTLGFILPYSHIRNRVAFSVSGGNFGSGTSTVQQLLTDPANGYAYQPIQDTTTSGFGDPTVGGLWRLYKGPRDSAVLALGVHLGLAAADDPDDLLDVQAGDGSTDLEARLEYFRDLGRGWDLRLLARHREQTADHVVKRVPAAGALLATAASKERLRRDLGDYREFDVELGRAWGDWRGSLTWHLYDKDPDRYTSALGSDTRPVAANTEIRADQWRAGLSWSGVRAWQAGRLPLPLIVKLEMQDTYGGYNFPKVRDWYLQITSFF